MRPLVLIIGIAVAGCASTGFLMAKPQVVLYGQAYPAKGPEEPVLTFETTLPDRQYLEIARISCGDTDDNWNMQQILMKAREIGADGLIIVGRSGSTALAVPVAGGAYGVSESYGIVAIAIRFKNEVGF